MTRLALLFALTGWLAAVPFAGAADQPASPPRSGELVNKLQEISTRLELTDEQKDAIAPILEKEIADLKTVRDATSMRRLQKARRVREITETASQQIRALLSPEQQTEYDKLRAEMREKMRARAKERHNAEN